MSLVPPVDPYTFADGPGNRAYGTQVNERFNRLYLWLNDEKPYAEASRSATQSLTTATQTAISFDTEVVDYDTMFAATSTQIIATKAGVYMCTGVVPYIANATGVRYAAIRKNGTTIPWAAQVGNAGAGDGVFVPVSGPLALNATDYVELIGYQNSGGALNVAAGARLAALWQSPLP